MGLIEEIKSLEGTRGHVIVLDETSMRSSDPELELAGSTPSGWLYETAKFVAVRHSDGTATAIKSRSGRLGPLEDAS